MLQIAELGCDVLRKVAAEVCLSDIELPPLAEDMLATINAGNNIAIAAPQVHISKRCFIYSCFPKPGHENRPLIEPTFVINPEILWVSDEKDKGWELCLSIPGIAGLVLRHKSIKVRYSTLSRNSVECELSGFPARIFQHEYDHLDGLVYLDRLESNRDIITEKEYQKLIG